MLSETRFSLGLKSVFIGSSIKCGKFWLAPEGTRLRFADHWRVRLPLGQCHCIFFCTTASLERGVWEGRLSFLEG
jgi:hypothetical protein